tara:strand:- start:2023 stop:2397 length:375 start_codon:yes stop_codon:yes gene_type:complete
MAKNDSVWSIEDLVALTDEIQKSKVDYRGKIFSFEYAELTEEEEPKMVPLGDGATDEEQANWYQKVGSERILGMITKAHKLNPEGEGERLNEESWKKLPATLRYKIIAEVLNLEGGNKENFTVG